MLQVSVITPLFPWTCNWTPAYQLGSVFWAKKKKKNSQSLVPPTNYHNYYYYNNNYYYYYYYDNVIGIRDNIGPDS